MALAVEPEAETVLDDRYEIQAVLGRGGMGAAAMATAIREAMRRPVRAGVS